MRSTVDRTIIHGQPSSRVRIFFVKLNLRASGPDVYLPLKDTEDWQRTFTATNGVIVSWLQMLGGRYTDVPIIRAEQPLDR